MLVELIAEQRRTQQMLAESAAEERRTQQILAENTAAQLRTQQMVAEFMTALRVSGMGDVRPRYPWGELGESSPTQDRLDTPRLGGRLVRDWRRAADELAPRLAALPDVAEVLLLEMRSIAVVVSGQPVYADLIVTNTLQQRWLAELKVNLGPLPVREARRAAAQKLLDAAGSDLRWALATRAQAARADTWRKLAGESNTNARLR